MYGFHGTCWHTKSDATGHTFARYAKRYASTRHAYGKITDKRYANEIDLRVRTAGKSYDYADSAVLQLDAGSRYTTEDIVERRHNEDRIYVRIASKSIDNTNAQTV